LLSAHQLFYSHAINPALRNDPRIIDYAHHQAIRSVSQFARRMVSNFLCRRVPDTALKRLPVGSGQLDITAKYYLVQLNYSVYDKRSGHIYFSESL